MPPVAPRPPDAAPAGDAAPALLRQRGSNHTGLRQFNERVVLQALRTHGSLAKAEIARVTGLTAQTIGLIAARLDADRLLRREAPVRGRVGQPSVPISLNPDGAFAIGVKIGRRSADWLLVDFTGQVRERIRLDYAFPDIEQLLPAIDRHLQQLLAGLGALRTQVVGVGVAAPFQLGGWHRMLGLTAAQSQAWNGIDLAAQVQQQTDLPVHFAKDTTAACVAELLQGRGRDTPSFLYLFMDTFVGGGLVLDSQLRRGLHGNAGAVASLPLAVAKPGADQAGPAAAVGPPSAGGAVEALPAQLIRQASLWELEQRFRAHGLDPMAAYDERALQNPWAAHSQAWMSSAATALAHCMVSATALLDLDAVVIDAATAPDLLQALADRTRQALRHYNWEGLHAPPRLELGSIGSDARALGGALLPLHASFAPGAGSFLKE